jgi:hypothetical protein
VGAAGVDVTSACRREASGPQEADRVEPSKPFPGLRKAMWRTLAWETSLPASECRLRLEHYAEPDSIVHRFRFDAKGTVYASLRASSFRLFARGPAFVRNSVEPYFYGSIVEEGGRTLVRGQFRMHPFTLGFMALWFFGVVTIGGLMSVVMLHQILTGRRPPEAALAPGLAIFIGPGMLAFGVGLVFFGWRLGRGQRERIEQFLETTLQLRRLR